MFDPLNPPLPNAPEGTRGTLDESALILHVCAKFGPDRITRRAYMRMERYMHTGGRGGRAARGRGGREKGRRGAREEGADGR